LPGAGADAGVGERLDKVADGRGVEDRVGVHHDDEVVGGPQDAGVESERLATVGPADDGDLRDGE